MRPGLSLNMYAVDRQLLNNFSAGQWAMIRECVSDDADSPRTDVLVQTQFRTPSPISRDEHRTEKRDQPAEILSRQQVQRSAQPPRADDSALINTRPFDISSYQPGAANAYRERCGRCLLRLDTTQVIHDLRDARFCHG